MKIKVLEDSYSCASYEKMPENLPEIYFFASTGDEISIFSKSENLPKNATNIEGGFKGFVIDDTLDFSLIGIIARITSILADNDISVFVTSTFKTDYFFVKEENLALSLQLLNTSGYDIL